MALLILGALSVAIQATAIVVAWRVTRAARSFHAWLALAGLCAALTLLSLLEVLRLRELPRAATDLAVAGLILLAVLGVRSLLRGLWVRAGQQTMVAELGLRALAGLEPQQLLEGCAEAVAGALGVPLVKILRCAQDGQSLLLQAGVGYDPSLLGSATVPARSGSQAGFALASRTPVVVEDLRSETRFTPTPLLLEHGAVSGICVAIGRLDRPLGLLGAHAHGPRRFSRHDIDFVQAVANVIASAMERAQTEAERRQAAASLREVQDHFAAFMENLPGVAFIKDAAGRYLFANREGRRVARQLPGPEPRDPIGRTDSEFGLPELALRIRRDDLVVLEHGGPLQTVEVLPDSGGPRSWLITKFRLTATDGAALVGSIGIDVTDRQRAEQALSALSGRLLTAHEEERRRIARELHDEIGQVLTLVKMDIESLRDARRGGLAAMRLGTDVDIVDRAIRQVRELALDLHPAILDDLGLPAALRWYLDRIPGGKLAVHLSVEEGDGKALAAHVRTAAFRIAQEAITNLLRHAQARSVWVRLAAHPSGLELSVRDDGRGFDLAAARRQPSDCFGLSSMEERVRLVGGRLEIRTAPGAGTEVWALFPAPA